MDRGGSVARCRLIAVLTVRISRLANPSGSKTEGHWWKEELWGLTPESVSTMRVSGPRKPGDSACVGSHLRLEPDAQKHRGAPDRSGTPLCIPLNGSTTRSSDRLRSSWRRSPEGRS